MSNDFYFALFLGVFVFLWFPVTMLRQVEHPTQQVMSKTGDDGTIYVSIPIELEPYKTPNLFYIAHLIHFYSEGWWLHFTSWYTDGTGWNRETWPWWAKTINNIYFGHHFKDKP